MPQLMLRDVDFSLIRLLKQRAAKHGRPPEAEHRAILEQALRGEQPGGSKLDHLRVFAALGGNPGGAKPVAGDPEGSAG